MTIQHSQPIPLSGLTRAESAIGDNAAAAQTWRQLLDIWKNADPGYLAQQGVPGNLSSASRAAN